ncbi:MAG: L-threonylcarbamoyladenylate synthase [Acidimicrobiales bacterium]|jgi:tRNA threonylcarbamoyl adenosine modification protein (Sua5/YciO/YrdC/YwlC family)|nr:threonylcarbamoyl-AMP synthase [Acidimicrobiaceae bacterium]MDP6322361.1 L-threonylcarbamoyladenylate synthase [Acidimicrobiales bacterium]HJM37672.1 L-threonylcarbamoyladenylate synthase [Acidimicrobiales bacterium]
MKRFLDLSSDFELAVSEASQALNDGKLVLLPTDTVYGIAAIPTNKGAVEEIFRRKNRLDDQACAVLVSDALQASELVLSSKEFELLSQRFWPGPLTVVAGRSIHLGYFLGGDENSIGVRCPDHRFMQSLTKVVGPLAVTSANRSGLQTPENAKEAAEELGDNLLVIDGGECKGKPSTVVNLLSDKAEILREGALCSDDLIAAGLRL